MTDQIEVFLAFLPRNTHVLVWNNSVFKRNFFIPISIQKICTKKTDFLKKTFICRKTCRMIPIYGYMMCIETTIVIEKFKQKFVYNVRGICVNSRINRAISRLGFQVIRMLMRVFPYLAIDQRRLSSILFRMQEPTFL